MVAVGRARPEVPRVVWVVDDDAASLYAVTRHLESAGFAVSGFTSSMAALTRFDSGAPLDLLVADIMLGAHEPHGVSLGNMVQLKRPSVKVIYMTGFDEGRVKLGPLDTSFRKPIDLDNLTEAVRKALR